MKRPRSYLIYVGQGSNDRAWVQLNLCGRTRLKTKLDRSEMGEKLSKQSNKINYKSATACEQIWLKAMF